MLVVCAGSGGELSLVKVKFLKCNMCTNLCTHTHNIITVLVVTKSLSGFVLNQVQYNMESAQYLG